MSTGGEQGPPEILREMLEEVVDGLGLEATVYVSEGAGRLEGVVSGGDLGLLIGRRGQAIDAIQHLAQRIVFHGGRPETRVVVDADGYRGRREAELCEQADEAAARAVSGGEPVALGAMTSAERRIVHEHLRDRGDVQTHSEGDEPERHLVVEPGP